MGAGRLLSATQARARVAVLDEHRRPDIELFGMLLGASLLAVLDAVLRLP